MNKLSATLGAAAAFVLMAGTAHAVPCTGVSLGTSSTSDFTLNGADANACVISTVNPDQGNNGNPSGFSPSPFGTGWTLLTKVSGGTSPKVLDGVSFNWSLTGNGPTLGQSHDGDWSIGADKSIKVDLVVAMHAANRSGAFLFTDTTLVANQTQQGTWEINWVNQGGQNPAYSNASLWVRNVTAVPEPETYALMLAGLAAIGFIASRRATA